MTYTLKHTYLDEKAPISVSTIDDQATVNCSRRYNVRIKHPGRVTFSATANYRKRFFEQPLEGEGGPTHPHTDTIFLPLTLEIKRPDGSPFSGDQIRLADLAQYRDQRGVTQGNWSFSIRGSAGPFPVTPGEFEVSAGVGRVVVEIQEVVTTKSPPPLVKVGFFGSGQPHVYSFDLYRVGTLIATTDAGPMILRNPSGFTVATGNQTLTHPVTLETLAQSRDAAGLPRKWRLFVETPAPNESAPPHNLWASVLETARLRTGPLMERVKALLGEHGEKLSIYGENVTFEESGIHGGKQLALRLVINDEISAGTIDMHGLLDSAIQHNPQDSPEVNKRDLEIKKGVVYTVGTISPNLGNGLSASFRGIKVTTIDIGIGPRELTQPPVPELSLTIGVEGYVQVDFHGFPIATLKVRNGRISIKAGVRLNEEGSFVPEVLLDSDPLDIDVDWPAIVASGVLLGLIGIFGSEAAVEVGIEEDRNEEFKKMIRDVMESVVGNLPLTLAMILGDDFTYHSLRMEGEDILFDYFAPVEPYPQPVPSSVYEYVPIVGRAATPQGPHAWSFSEELGDTWKAEKLRARIRNIVVVMMENRSYDHVLGYRARQGGDGSNGLTDQLIEFLNAQAYANGQRYPVKELRGSGIIPNALGFKTHLDCSVGHSLADVTQQLSKKLEMESGGRINSPEGFVQNFIPRLGHALNHHPELKPEDVLGYYVGDDLPFFKYLAENYSFCDQYFSSHAGPTLPNRMIWLTGACQYDRNGEAILDNNHGDNFFLSRATTIFDLLSRIRFGIKWRVYESPPSVAMLRMFARYSTDNFNIVPISRLKEDVAKHPTLPLPPVVFIEPAMHHFPQNDDHPPTDMYYGQMFLKEIYDTLRSNTALWKGTLLIIMYDEHGGLYDHVVPPMAEARIWPTSPTGGGGGPFTPKTLVTHYGVRVPTFVVSPWVGAGKGPSIVLDHCSIAKTIIARFFNDDERPYLSERVHASRSFEAYIGDVARMDVPPSPPLTPLIPGTPQPGGIITRPVSRKEMRSGNVEYHELTGMLARMLGRDSPQ